MDTSLLTENLFSRFTWIKNPIKHHFVTRTHDKAIPCFFFFSWETKCCVPKSWWVSFVLWKELHKPVQLKFICLQRSRISMRLYRGRRVHRVNKHFLLRAQRVLLLFLFTFVWGKTKFSTASVRRKTPEKSLGLHAHDVSRLEANFANKCKTAWDKMFQKFVQLSSICWQATAHRPWLIWPTFSMFSFAVSWDAHAWILKSRSLSQQPPVCVHRLNTTPVTARTKQMESAWSTKSIIHLVWSGWGHAWAGRVTEKPKPWFDRRKHSEKASHIPWVAAIKVLVPCVLSEFGKCPSLSFSALSTSF